MNQNRLFQAVIGLALVVVAGLTARQAVLTAGVVSAAEAVTSAAATACPYTAAEALALQAVYSAPLHEWVTKNGAHAAGVDGGLLALGGCAAGAADPATQSVDACPFTADEARVLRAAYRAQGGGWVTQNGTHAAGVDGGLLSLLTCR